MKKQKKILLLLCVCCILVSIILRAFLIYGFISKFIISPREHEMICVSAVVIPNYYFGDGMWMKIKERDSYGRYLFYSSFSDMGTD